MEMNFRQTEILELARREGKVLVETLASRFDVTVQTIRRDLTELCESGKLERVYGGAMLASGVSNIDYVERRLLNAEEKQRIGQVCAALVPSSASIFIGIGTTAEAVARALLRHENLLVVTNNMNVANILIENSGCEMIVAGGSVRRSDGGLVGDVTADMVRQFKVDYAIIGASALDLEGDLLDFDFREVRVSQSIIRTARHNILVADHSKFQRNAPVRVASLGDLDHMVTDRPLPDPVATLCAEHATKVHVA
ncbi:DeoR/GlpR family DNA-binding transcription regulator [Algicella marina]|uniref:DeoR family transcriptional regulator n=1 Tax=Algicella marina TaxID=2683284 RepID=A0A6P1T4P1_9RHOB|nr:DeoR/GlpR family DNA-binding transcription regulator [Algicella marina]QHQ36741.1 DeoR family transcriptional regulator [Algicella marina]